MINIVPLDDHIFVVPTALQRARATSKDVVSKWKHVYFTKKMKWREYKGRQKIEGS